MSSTRVNKTPIAVAIVVLICLITIWHGRDRIPDHPIDYINKSLSNKPGAATDNSKRLSFYEIAMSHGTDKVTHHHYERMYEHLFAPLRDQHIKMLEIGLGCDMWYGPGASYKTWLEYFTNVDLYYMEYDGACAAKWANETTGATIFVGDQGDRASLEDFISQNGGDFDIIIDDGGHTMDQQKTSLDVLWKTVKPGGVYLVEDLDTSYIPQYGGGKDKPDTFMEDVKGMLDDMNKHKKRKDKHPASKEVERMEFTQEVVAFHKFNSKPAAHRRG